MNTRINTVLLVMMIVIMAVTFVSCDSQVDEPVDNMKTAEEWGIDVNYTERKPYAISDPNNPLDQKSEAIKTMEGVVDSHERFHSYKASYGRDVWIYISNSESINNLFYDYTLEDFGVEQGSYIIESGKTIDFPSYISSDAVWGDSNQLVHSQYSQYMQFSKLRDKLRAGEKVDLSTYCRRVTLCYGWRTYITDDMIKNGYNIPTESEWLDMLVAISKLDFVIHIDYAKGFFSTSPTGYDTDNSWGLERINAREAWDYTAGNPNVTVGIVDSGVNMSHSALAHANNFDLNYDPNGYDVCDLVGHGTMVAGVMFAEDSQNGVYGICHDAQFASLRTNSGGELENVDLFISCLEYAEEKGIPVLNFSGGFYTTYHEGCGIISEEKVDDLREAIAAYNGLLIVAAGNQGYNLDTNDSKLYPQSFDLDNVIVVGSSTSIDTRASDSNYGATAVDLFAPGQGICTTTKEGSYDTASGTSMSAPFVAGVAALLKSYNSDLTPAQIKEAILNSVTKVEALDGLCMSGGILNAEAALEYVCKHECETATSTNSTQHTGTCNLCGKDVVDEHEFSYTKISVSAGHRCTCTTCGYVGTEFHEWQPRYLMGELRGYECEQCGIFTLNIDIAHPGSLRIEMLQALTNNALSNEMNITYINEHVALLCCNGKYSLLIECDENGRPMADIPEGIFVDEFDTSELQQQLQIKSQAITSLQWKEKDCLDCNSLKDNDK